MDRYNSNTVTTKFVQDYIRDFIYPSILSTIFLSSLS